MSITIFYSTSVNVIEKLTIVMCEDISYAFCACHIVSGDVAYMKRWAKVHEFPGNG
jgi:hypothetical protein